MDATNHASVSPPHSNWACRNCKKNNISRPPKCECAEGGSQDRDQCPISKGWKVNKDYIFAFFKRLTFPRYRRCWVGENLQKPETRWREAVAKWHETSKSQRPLLVTSHPDHRQNSSGPRSSIGGNAYRDHWVPHEGEAW
jgi:hypothetical protein